ncbi:MAG: hypothetical protein Q4A40_04990 [Bacillota bacterium]|nr:hypothetical protein [Bacillota bacterium]
MGALQTAYGVTAEHVIDDIRAGKMALVMGIACVIFILAMMVEVYI